MNLEEAEKKGLVINNKGWYTYKNGDSEVKLGRADKAQEKLDSLIQGGKTQNESPPEPSGEKESSVEPPVNQKLLEPKKNSEQNLEDLFQPLMANLGDVESRRKGGRFRTFIFGVDSRHKENPVVKACPYVFRHNDIKNNVRSGNRVMNEGWTVLSKSMIKVDKRNGKPWLTVARDDSPEADFYQVGATVLCYADKKQFETKKGKMVMDNVMRSGNIASKRQETAERMAKISKDDPAASMQGFVNSNQAEKAKTAEYLEKSEKMSGSEAKSIVNSLDNFSGSPDDIDKQVKELRKQVEVPKSQGSEMTIDEV